MKADHPHIQRDRTNLNRPRRQTSCHTLGESMLARGPQITKRAKSPRETHKQGLTSVAPLCSGLGPLRNERGVPDQTSRNLEARFRPGSNDLGAASTQVALRSTESRGHAPPTLGWLQPNSGARPHVASFQKQSRRVLRIRAALNQTQTRLNKVRPVFGHNDNMQGQLRAVDS